MAFTAVDTSSLHVKALATSSSPSLPFAPLPCLDVQRSRRASASGHGGVLVAEDSKKRLECRAVVKEDVKSSTPTLDEARGFVDEDGDSSWVRAAGLLGEPDGASGPQRQWSLAWLFCNLEDVGDGGLLRSYLGISAGVQSSPPPRQKQDDSEKQDYYVNIGYAIRTLRDELPTMFYKELTHDIYRQDIVFRDPMNMVSGLNNYKLIFKALRFHGRIFFKALWVDILRVWQPSDNVIMVRWQVRGIPRVPWEAQGIFDGTSEYKLDKQGKIYEHKVDNVALNSRPKYKIPTMAELLRAAVCPSTPRPTFFQRTESSFWVIVPYLMQFTWVRYYLALKGTVGLYQHPYFSLEVKQFLGGCEL